MFAKAREKARQTACTSNLKQYGLATMMYVQDYDERMPRLRRWDGVAVGPWAVTACWCCPVCGGDLDPYTKNIQIYSCPNSPWTGRRSHGSYGFNCEVQGQALGMMTRPADTPGGSDANCHFINPGSATGTCGPCNNVLPCPRVAWDRHNEGFVVWYCDGHAKWQKGQNMYDPAKWRR